MSNQPAEELRRKTIELENTKVALAEAEKRESSLKRDFTTLSHNVSTLQKETATAHEINKQLRAQLEVHSATAKEVAELKRVLSNFNQSVAVELTNKVAASITPHLQLTAQEVGVVRESLVKVKKEFTTVLGEMEMKARAQGEAITADYVTKVNSGWSIAAKKYAAAIETLNRTYAVNYDALSHEVSLVNSLVADMKSYRGDIIGLHNATVEGNRANSVMSEELKAAVKRFEGLTSETLTTVAATARQTIVDITKAAHRNINSAVRRPALKITLTVMIAGILSAWTAGQLVERRMNGVVAAAASASTEAVLQKVQPALNESNERAAKVTEQTKDLSRLHEYAALWVALMYTANETEQWKLHNRALDYAQKNGMFLPLTLAKKAEAIRMSKPVEPDPVYKPRSRRR